MGQPDPLVIYLFARFIFLERRFRPVYRSRVILMEKSLDRRKKEKRKKEG